VKYIAKSAAKNMSSDESHTMVPTATRFGRLTLGAMVALDILRIISEIAHKLTTLMRETSLNYCKVLVSRLTVFIDNWRTPPRFGS